jgi:hypothetical protein
MPVQDDARERELLQLFNLYVPEERKRAETDAFLRIEGREIPFELKSATGASVSTVRDFGAEHIAKWRDKHWIFGFYDKAGTRLRYCHYASPADMAPWIAEKERYVRPDIVLATEVPPFVTRDTLVKILGEKDVYSYEDLRGIMKKQWKAERYKAASDVRGGGYSLDRMVELLRQRCAYVISRGATLNNPHIRGAYFKGWDRITEDHAAVLRTKVRAYLAATSADATDPAT